MLARWIVYAYYKNIGVDGPKEEVGSIRAPNERTARYIMGTNQYDIPDEMALELCTYGEWMAME